MRLAVLAALLVIVTCSFAQAPPLVLGEPATFTVYPDQTFQTMAGFGAGMYQGTMSDLESLKAEERAKAYELVYGDKGLGLNIIRFHVSWTTEPLGPDDPLRAKGLHYDWEKDAFTQAVWNAVDLALQHAHAPILYAVPFTPPVRWKTNGKPNFGGSVPPKNYREYAEYLADFVTYYKTIHSVDINVLSLQNEPDISVYWESCRWTGEELRDFLKILGPLFRERGLKTRFMIPEGSTWDEAWTRAEPALTDPEARKYLDILASHTYGDNDLVDQGRSLMSTAAARFSIPIWMSETSIIGPPDDTSIFAGLQIAHRIYRDLSEGNASAWNYCFIIFTAKFPGSMGVLSPPKDGQLIVPKRFWTMANYSHFVRPGWRRMRIDGITFANSAFVSPTRDTFAIIALNATVNGRPATYDFGGFNVSEVKAYRTSKELDLAEVERPATEVHRFSATLAPFSVTTFVGKLKPAID